METLNVQPPSIEWMVYRNDTTVLTMILVDENDREIDITDWEFTGLVREYPSDATEISELQIVKNGNSLTVALDNSDLPLISYFDIQGINTVNDNVSTVLRGQITVEEDVTR
jgi:hypothetical protein